MKKIIILPVLLIIFSQSQSYAQATRHNAAEDYQDSDWSIAFGAAWATKNIQHSETSSNASYQSVDKNIRVPDVKMSLTVFKEFLSSKRISFTASLFAGVADSDGKSPSGLNSGYEFLEKVTGMHFGAGVSVNYNMYYYGLKLQPYIGARLIQDQGELNLTHSDGSLIFNTIHEFSSQVAHLGAGLRAFDADNSLMSYIEFSSPQELSETLTPRGQVSGSDIVIASTTDIQREVIAFSMGFGYFF